MLNYHYLCQTYELKPLISIHSQICVQKLVPTLLLDGWTDRQIDGCKTDKGDGVINCSLFSLNIFQQLHQQDCLFNFLIHEFISCVQLCMAACKHVLCAHRTWPSKWSQGNVKTTNNICPTLCLMFSGSQIVLINISDPDCSLIRIIWSTTCQFTV